MLVARRQPRDPEGWLLIGVAVGIFAVLDSGLYAYIYARKASPQPASASPAPRIRFTRTQRTLSYPRFTYSSHASLTAWSTG